MAPVGRMALTNYLAHPLVYVFVFYGIGLGLMGKVGAAFCVALGLIVFAAQIAFSRWWLARYRFGPMEWVWRSLTYGARHYTPNGRLDRPLLAVHTTGDVLVPPATVFEYALAVQQARREPRFVQQYVTADEHCEITPEQTGRAFDELVGWVARDARPASGPLQ